MAAERRNRFEYVFVLWEIKGGKRVCLYLGRIVAAGEENVELLTESRERETLRSRGKFGSFWGMSKIEWE